jgi:hypothetical protein
VAASFLYDFDKYIGIEYLENLHTIALEIKNLYDLKYQEINKINSELLPLRKTSNTPILELYNSDFLLHNWENASFIFANSTCFSPELMNAIAKKADEVKVGTIIVTFTKRLPNLSDAWEVKDGFRRLMSWGIATIYIHRKIKDN